MILRKTNYRVEKQKTKQTHINIGTKQQKRRTFFPQVNTTNHFPFRRLTSSSVADLGCATSTFVLSALDWLPVWRMPGTQDMKPPLEAEATGTLSVGALGPKDEFALTSGRWTGLASGVEVWDLTP